MLVPSREILRFERGVKVFNKRLGMRGTNAHISLYSCVVDHVEMRREQFTGFAAAGSRNRERTTLLPSFFERRRPPLTLGRAAFVKEHEPKNERSSRERLPGLFFGTSITWDMNDYTSEECGRVGLPSKREVCQRMSSDRRLKWHMVGDVTGDVTLQNRLN